MTKDSGPNISGVDSVGDGGALDGGVGGLGGGDGCHSGLNLHPAPVPRNWMMGEDRGYGERLGRSGGRCCMDQNRGGLRMAAWRDWIAEISRDIRSGRFVVILSVIDVEKSFRY